MTAPSCTDAETARSNPGRSECSRLPAARFNASSALQEHGKQRGSPLRLGIGAEAAQQAAPSWCAARQSFTCAGLYASKALDTQLIPTCVRQKEEPVQAVDHRLYAPAAIRRKCNLSSVELSQVWLPSPCCRTECGCLAAAASLLIRARAQPRQQSTSCAATGQAHMSGLQSAPSRLMSTCPSLSIAGWKTCRHNKVTAGSQVLCHPWTRQRGAT